MQFTFWIQSSQISIALLLCLPIVLFLQHTASVLRVWSPFLLTTHCVKISCFVQINLPLKSTEGYMVGFLCNLRKNSRLNIFNWLYTQASCSYHRRIPCKLRDWASPTLAPVTEVLVANLWVVFSQTFSCLSPYNTTGKKVKVIKAMR